MDGPSEAKVNVQIDDSTSAEVNLNGNSNKVLNQIFGNPRTRQEPEYAYKICMEKKCIHFDLVFKAVFRGFPKISSYMVNVKLHINGLNQNQRTPSSLCQTNLSTGLSLFDGN